MSPRRICMGLVVVASAGASGQTTAPAGKASQDLLSTPQLAEKVTELGQQLPSSNIKAPPPTPQQQARAFEACGFYEKACKRLAELGHQDKLNLSLLGIRAGFAAGEPGVMLSAAKLRWALEKQDTPSDYAGYALAWAGIFAADADAAKEGLRHIIEHTSQESLATWAKAMLPIAGQCDKPAKLSFRLIDGGKVDLQRTGGKVVVLHFWASWSRASTTTIPILKSFYDARRQDKDFMLVGISMDRAESDAKRQIRQSGMNWPQAMGRALRSRFLGQGAPHIAVISAKGHILWQGHPALKDTVVFVTDFARRQAARMRGQEPQTTRPKAPPKAPREPPRPKPTAAQEAQAEQQYKQARIYMKLRMRQKATAALQQIIRKYPGTQAAEKARLDLKYWH